MKMRGTNSPIKTTATLLNGCVSQPFFFFRKGLQQLPN
jgi:hypothetical protein